MSKRLLRGYHPGALPASINAPMPASSISPETKVHASVNRVHTISALITIDKAAAPKNRLRITRSVRIRRGLPRRSAATRVAGTVFMW